MTAIKINGKEIAQKIEADVKRRVAKLNRKRQKVVLEVILIGNNPASESYVKRKKEAAQRVGIEFNLHRLPKKTSKISLINKIKEIQRKKISGLLIQLPLPEKLYTEEILNTINPEIDVDCLTHENLGRLVFFSNFISPPTPAAALTILDELKVELAGKNVTVVGMGALVGKPLAIMLANQGATLTTCNIHTQNLKEKCLGADIIISAVGKKDLIQGDMVKEGAIIIDTGFVREGGKLMGDVNILEVEQKASYLTPTPGGVGPVTVARLLLNTVICAERKSKK